MPGCARCPIEAGNRLRQKEDGKFFKYCPTMNNKEAISSALKENDEKTEFNIVMGLCVGHDSLFLKYSDAPCTVLAAKDRLLGHNPLAATYTVDSYYR